MLDASGNRKAEGGLRSATVEYIPSDLTNSINISYIDNEVCE